MRGLLEFLRDVALSLLGRAIMVAGAGLILFGSFSEAYKYYYYIGAAVFFIVGVYIASRGD